MKVYRQPYEAQLARAKRNLAAQRGNTGMRYMVIQTNHVHLVLAVYDTLPIAAAAAAFWAVKRDETRVVIELDRDFNGKTVFVPISVGVLERYFPHCQPLVLATRFNLPV